MKKLGVVLILKSARVIVILKGNVKKLKTLKNFKGPRSSKMRPIDLDLKKADRDYQKVKKRSWT